MFYRGHEKIIYSKTRMNMNVHFYLKWVISQKSTFCRLCLVKLKEERVPSLETEGFSGVSGDEES